MSVTEDDLAAVRAVRSRVEDDLLALEGVTGIDVDEKLQGGKPTGRAAIVVFVARKLPPNQVPQGQFIPPVIDGVPTDVRELSISLQSANS